PRNPLTAAAWRGMIRAHLDFIGPARRAFAGAPNLCLRRPSRGWSRGGSASTAASPRAGPKAQWPCSYPHRHARERRGAAFDCPCSRELRRSADRLSPGACTRSLGPSTDLLLGAVSTRPQAHPARKSWLTIV